MSQLQRAAGCRGPWGPSSLLQTGVAPGFLQLGPEFGGVGQAFQGTDVRYLYAFSKVEIPVLDKLTLSDVYWLISKPQGQLRGFVNGAINTRVL